MNEQKYNNLKLGERGAILSIITYIILSIFKLIVGAMSDSQALKADGLNNVTDIIASVAVLIGLKFAQIPPDKNHKYGHWKSETIASLVASFIMMVVGIQVFISAIRSLFQGGQTSPDIIAGYVGIISFLIMYAVYLYNKKLALKIESKSVMAAAKDNLSDAWVSIGTAVGIFGAQLNMPWLDTITALIVGFLICKTAWGIFTEASHDLSDGFDEDKIQHYFEVVQTVPGVQKVKEVKGRMYGNNEVIDVVIIVQSTLTIHEAHEIATSVEKVLEEQHDVYDVHVHVEPTKHK